MNITNALLQVLQNVCIKQSDKKELCMSIIFHPSLIALNTDYQKPEDVIKKSGELLREAQLCTEGYIDAMLQGYHQFGAYIVLDSGIAMPHARPEKGALATGFSIMTLKNPVCFGNQDFDPVSVAIAIVGHESSAHIQLIQLVASLIEHNIVSVATQATSQQHLFDFINPFLTEENKRGPLC